MCCGSADEIATQNCCSNGGSDFWWKDATFVGPLNASTLMNVTAASGVIPGAGPSTVTVTSTAAPQPSSEKGVAIGLGIGLGVPLIIAIVTIMWLLLALMDTKRKLNQGPQHRETTWSNATSSRNINMSFSRNKIRHELNAENDRAELEPFEAARN